MNNQTVFILDTYNSHAPKSVQELIRYKFLLNDNWYAIYEIQLEWGKPAFPWRPLEEETLPNFYYFQTFEAAMIYVRELKRINAGL